jgi:class 3 adenylate cyclase
VPAAVADQVERGDEPSTGLRHVSILFVDIRSSTQLTEEHGAEGMFELINRFTESTSHIMARHGGTIAEFSGDGVMVIFGAPKELPSTAEAAIDAGREVIASMASIRPRGREDSPLSIGIGIASGEAAVGSVGPRNQRIWTAIGTVPNRAARLQEMSRDLNATMVVDAATWTSSSNAAAGFVCMEKVALRGLAVPEKIYYLPLGAVEPVGLAADQG